MSKYTTNQFSSNVPLRYDTVYYVECPGNDKLNHIMYQMQQDGPLFFDKNLLLFSIKLQYISQKELSNDYLRAQLSGSYDAEDVDDAIFDLRDCLSADKGGTLTARYMPSKGSDDTLWDVCSLSLIDITYSDEIYERAISFARDVAETDFYRVSGVPYRRYLKAKEDEYDSYGHTMSLITTNTRSSSSYSSRIIQDAQAGLLKICSNLKNESDLKDFAQMLESVIKMTKKIGKQNVFCQIVVENNKIWLKNPDGKYIQVRFSRYGVAKALYIFFLRQIERAAKNNCKPIYVSKAGLMDYEDELLAIYESISSSTTKKNIESLLDDFANSLSSIRGFFDEIFDVEAIKDQFDKCYSIEIMGKDNKFNSDLYDIDLEPEDFDLGEYSIDRLKV